MALIETACPEIPDASPIILFGAHDRHNFGDLLFAHIAAALLRNTRIMFAGLLERDMRIYGGHMVHALPDLARRMQKSPVRILHAGGELLTCSAWEAAVMLQPASEKEDVTFRYGKNVHTEAHWARTFLGMADHAPYMVPRTLFPLASAVAYNAVGGVDLPSREPALQAEVLRKLAEADDVAVRDRHTLATLRAAGIDARLMPDPAVMVAELFGARIAQHVSCGEPAQTRAALPQGYIAVQFSTDFKRHIVLEMLATQLQRVAVTHRCGIVLFRAGAAPWHDELESYRLLAVRLRDVPVRIFHSLDIWDICALIARSQGYCGSSLHGRIVALAFGRPRINLLPPDQPATVPTKQEAFVQTWEDSIMPGVVAIEDLEPGLLDALHADPQRLQDKAAELATLYQEGFRVLHAHFMKIA
jgi:hypothetical protein